MAIDQISRLVSNSSTQSSEELAKIQMASPEVAGTESAAGASSFVSWKSQLTGTVPSSKVVGSIFTHGVPAAKSEESGPVHEVATTAELKQLIADNPNKTVVVYFSLPSCKPCEEFYPNFIEQANGLSMTDDDVVFVYCSNSDVPYETLNWPNDKAVGFPIVIGFKDGKDEIFFNREDLQQEIESFGMPMSAKIENYENKLNSFLPEVKIKGAEALAMIYLGAQSGEMTEEIKGVDFNRAIFASRNLALTTTDDRMRERAIEAYSMLLGASGKDGVAREAAVLSDLIASGTDDMKAAACTMLAKVIKNEQKSPDDNTMDRLFILCVSKESRVREGAAVALGAAASVLPEGDKKLDVIAKQLIALLEDEDPSVVAAAAKQLKNFGPTKGRDATDAIVESLIELAGGDDDKTRAGALEGLSTYFNVLDPSDRADVVSFALKAMMSRDEKVRNAAQKLLKGAVKTMSPEEVKKVLPVVVAKLDRMGPNYEENAQIRYGVISILLPLTSKLDDAQKRSIQGVVRDTVQHDNYRWTREVAGQIQEMIK